MGVIIGMDPHKRSATIEVTGERGSVLAAARYGTDKAAALGIGPVHGQQIEIAGLVGGQLSVVTADGWRARRSARGVTLAGPAAETVAVDEAEQICAFGFSLDGQSFILASSPSLMIFRRDTT